MSLRVVIDGTSRQAWDIDQAEWDRLRSRSRAGGEGLAMPCCGARAIPKTSSLGFRFFSHHTAATACPGGGGESERHERLKAMLAQAALAAGWGAVTEAPGVSATGEAWQADVLAERDGVRVALEVQLSPQDLSTYRQRQARYRASGVFALWFAAALPAGYGESRDLPIWKLERGGAADAQERLKGRPLTAFVQDFLERRYTFVANETLVDAPACLVPVRDRCPACAATFIRTPIVVVFPGEVRGGLARREHEVATLLRMDQANALIRARAARTGERLALYDAVGTKFTRDVRIRPRCPGCGAPLRTNTAASVDTVRALWRDPGLRDGTVRLDLGLAEQQDGGWVLRDTLRANDHRPAPDPSAEADWLAALALGAAARRGAGGAA